MSDGGLLRGVPLLAGVPDELRAEIELRARPVSIDAGRWLFHEGDVAESLYVIRSGRFEVVAEGPPEVLIRTLRRGDALGELALLTAGRRSASVRARRDGRLVEVGREAFEALIREAPELALELARSIGSQLAASKAPDPIRRPPRSVAVFGLTPGAAAATVAELLVAELGRHGTVAELRSGGAETLDRAERDSEHVVMIAGDDDRDPWVSFCLSEAERVIAVSEGEPAPRRLAGAERLCGCDLLIVGTGASEESIRPLRPREVEICAARHELAERVARRARRLAGTSIGLALSGGGARAFAHLGVIEEVEAAGIVVDRIGAVSMGALVGGAFACGFETGAIWEAFSETFGARSPTADYTLPVYSLTRGRRADRALRSLFGERRIEALPRRFFSVSCDLAAREVVRHRTGLLRDAVRASFGIPGIFPPLPTPEGRLLVDGGVLENLPVEAMCADAEGPVIAVDVTEQHVRERGPATGRGRRALRRVLAGSDATIPRLGETMVRTLTVGSVDTVAAARQHADLVINPRVGGIGMLDWSRLVEAREEGREAARVALSNPLACGAIRVDGS